MASPIGQIIFPNRSNQWHRSEGFLNGYFIPVRYGLGVSPDWRVVGAPSPPSPSASPGNSGWHSGWGTLFGVFKLEFGSYESSRNFETGVLNRVSSRIDLAEWFGLGSHFGKTCYLVNISTNNMFTCWGTFGNPFFDNTPNMFKWPYLQFPPVQNSNSSKNQKSIKVPHIYPSGGPIV